MRIEVRLPEWGMGEEEGTLLTWEVKVGETVNKGDVIATVETAKAVGEVEAPEAGIIAEIIVGEGDTVPTRTVLAIIDAPQRD